MCLRVRLCRSCVCDEHDSLAEWRWRFHCGLDMQLVVLVASGVDGKWSRAIVLDGDSGNAGDGLQVEGRE